MYSMLAICALISMTSPGGGGGGISVRGADLILLGGKILTLNEPEPDPAPTAVVLVGNRILFVGSDRDALTYRTERTTVVELDGAVVVPGFSDAHAHLYGLGKSLAEVDLVGTRSAAEVIDRVRAAAAGAPAGTWLEGRGWDQNDWPVPEFPSRAPLDEAVADRPVCLRRVDGHAAWVNSVALGQAGIDATTGDPDGGRILHDAAGEPTGILVDNAIDLVRDIIPEVSAAEMRQRVELAVAHCLRHGLTGVHEAGVPNRRLDLYTELAEADELGLRLYCLLEDDPETLDRWLAQGRYISRNRLLSVRAVKLYADGALGSRGALLLDDYSDDPGNHGLQLTSRQHLATVARRAAEAGFQVCTHAIGDGGNRLVLDLYEEILADLALGDVRWRVEHAQVLHPDDLPRFARLGVIASMQPVHCTSDLDWATARLGPERVLGSYAWRSLLDSGAHLCFGTDFPVERVDPLHGLYSARTRTHHDGTPVGGWYPEQCLSGREALRLYTLGPAHASFREHDLGQVRANRLADLTVLSGDPTSCPPQALLSMQVLLTIVGGKIRYDGR